MTEYLVLKACYHDYVRVDASHVVDGDGVLDPRPDARRTTSGVP